MNNLRLALLSGLLLCLALPTSAVNVPAPLEPWVDWVLHNHQNRACPMYISSADRYCLWPGTLSVTANDKGAEFTQTLTLYQESYFPLPGNHEHWPSDLRANGQPFVVLADGKGTPQGFLPAGEYRITGAIRWQQLPRSLAVSEHTGRIELTVNGVPVSHVRLEGQNQLMLGEVEDVTTDRPQNSLSIRVFRQLNDDIPQQIITEVQLDVSGSEREVLLGQILPDGFVPWQFDSALPAQLEANGQVRAQLRPGRWQMRLHSYSLAPPETLGFTQTTEHWPESEIWVFRAFPDYRTVQVEGAPGIDPTQTSLPADWQRFPAFLVTPDTSLTLIEQHRAPSHFGDHELQLSKTLWLDFDGAGFTVRDHLSGQLKGHARLETVAPYELGSATSNHNPLLVTRLSEGDMAGIEVRDQHANITAFSRLPRQWSLPVSGWQADFSAIEATLHLPPGWSLLVATGADQVSGAWLDNWNLWDIFLVLVISVAIGRAGSWPLGLLSLVTLVLIYQRAGAPVLLWLNFAACLALAHVVTERWHKPLRAFTLASFALLVVVYLPFATAQARLGVYPQLEHPGVHVSTGAVHEVRLQADKSRAQPEALQQMEEALVTRQRGATPQFEEEPSFSAPAPASAPAPRERVPLGPLYGPNQLIQAGPVEPRWFWNHASLRWSGPIKAEQEASLILVPPFINRLGYFLAVLAPLLMAMLLWRKLSLPTPAMPRTPTGATSALLLVLGISMLPTAQPEAAVLIDSELLNELEQRLTQAPDCLPACASIESVDLRVEDNQLRITLQVHTQNLVALPLPVRDHQWQPSQVLLNNANAALTRKSDGQLLLALPQGSHQISLYGSLEGLQQVNLPFGMAIHNLRSTLQGWQLSGAPRGQTPSRDLQLARVLDPETTVQTSLQPSELPAFVSVTRTLNLGLEWTVDTTVQRRAPARGAINLAIPLLPGESPLSGDVNEDNAMLVSLSPEQTSFTWSSVLAPIDQLTLQAPDVDSPWTERWYVYATSVWHIQTEGEAILAGGNTPLWQPRPGDSLTLNVSRPEAVRGETLTVTRANLVQQTGARGHSIHLSLGIKTHQGGNFDFTLPADAELTQLNINGRQQPLIKTRGELRIPVTPGEQTIDLQWDAPEAIGISTQTPTLNLGHNTGNIGVSLNLPHNRWTLLTGGPSVGPAVQVWGVLLVVLLVAVGLGRSGLTPLRTWEWILLSLGIVAVNGFLLAFAALWFIVLAKRGQYQPKALGRYFNLAQLLLGVFTVITLAVLISAIPFGLLAQPAMLVTGNGSHAYQLNWYLDQSNGALPVGWVLSLPLWVYRLAILLWSLWLAVALTRWLPWAWRQLGANGWWQHAPRATKAP